MTDVLGNTAGYIDSELSDYDDNYGESLNSNYYHFNEGTNGSFNSKNSNYNFKSYGSNERVSPLSVNSRDVISDKLGKFGKCVTGNQQKSPRFGREDLNSAWIQNGSNFQKVNRELLYNRTSLDTVDSLTPLSNNFEKSFKWWRDDEFNNLESENNTEVENTEAVNSPEKELNEASDPSEPLEADNNVEWQSWTADSGDLLELRNKLMNKLLNVNRQSEDISNNLQDSCQQDNSQNNLKEGLEWNELKFYKELNKLLVDKLLYLLSHGSHNLVFDLNQHYVTSIQNHLTKVHNYLNSYVSSDSSNNPLLVNEDKNSANEVQLPCNNQVDEHVNNNINSNNNSNNSNNYNYEQDNEDEIMRLRRENEQLRDRLEAVESRCPPKPEGESNLAEKLKLVQESKNALEEDFKKTLVYMRLMKDRLKLLYSNPNNPNPNYCVNFNNYKGNNYKDNYTNNYPTNNYKDNYTNNYPSSKPNNKLLGKRSNSCVRFKDTSELYVVPRSKSESKAFVTSSNQNNFTKFFKFFNHQ